MLTVKTADGLSATIDENLVVKSSSADFKALMETEVSEAKEDAAGGVNLLAFVFYHLQDLGFDIIAEEGDLEDDFNENDIY